eukprot:11800_1
MGNTHQMPLPQCCHQVLIPQKTSTSRLFNQDAMRMHKSKRKKTGNAISPKSNDEMSYCLELSDCESDYTLCEPLALPSLQQSLTTSADHELEEAIITEPYQTSPRKQLSECEMKLKQEQHQKSILKRENQTLRKTISTLRNKYGVTAIDTTESYDVASITSNWSGVSPRSESKQRTPSAYSPMSPRQHHYPSVPSEDESEHSLTNCMSLKRIIEALQWYSIHGNDHESVYKKMRYKNYGKQIADDYEHLMRCHLDESDDATREYHLICAKINRTVAQCTFQPCTGHRRYLRSRNCENVHKAQTPRQHELQNYINTMDGIHSCFLHLATK